MALFLGSTVRLFSHFSRWMLSCDHEFDCGITALTHNFVNWNGSPANP